MPLVQSSSFEQLPPGWQAEQSGPPQSTSVSRPFFSPSSQVGWAQVPPLQTPD
jgi:hypothetical protein